MEILLQALYSQKASMINKMLKINDLFIFGEYGCEKNQSTTCKGDLYVYERVGLETILDHYGIPAAVDVVAAKQRAEYLVALGFGVADATHVAFAEQSGVAFISCDGVVVPWLIVKRRV